MKKIILILVSLAAISLCEARAQLYLGGSLSLSTRMSENSRFLDVMPEVGYALGDWCVGTVLEFNFSSDGTGETYDAQHAIGFTPYVEYYFWESGPLSFYAEAGCEFRFFRSLNPTFNSTRICPYLAPGLEFSLSDHWSVISQLGQLEWNSNDKSLNFDINGSALSLGLLYTF